MGQGGTGQAEVVVLTTALYMEINRRFRLESLPEDLQLG